MNFLEAMDYVRLDGVVVSPENFIYKKNTADGSLLCRSGETGRWYTKGMSEEEVTGRWSSYLVFDEFADGRIKRFTFYEVQQSYLNGAVIAYKDDEFETMTYYSDPENDIILASQMALKRWLIESFV